MAVVFTLSGLGLAGGAAFAAEFEVLDRLSVDGYSVLRGSADISGSGFSVGGSTFVVKAGNVGIGTTAAVALLSLGNGNAQPLPAGTKLWIGGTGSSQIRSRISLGVDPNVDYGAYIAASSFGAGGTDQALELGSRGGGADQPAVYLRNSNVGVGIAGPQANLHVSGRVGIVANGYRDFSLGAGRADGAGHGYPDASAVDGNGSFAIRDQWEQKDRIRIDNSGNVGIGTTGPTSLAAYKTEIYGADPHLGLSGSVNGVGQLVGLEFNQMTTSAPQTRPGGAIKSAASGTYTGGSGGTYNSDLAFYTGAGGTNTERIRILSGGNIGIGTTNPGWQAVISGAAQTTANITDGGSKGATLLLAGSDAGVGAGGALLFGVENSGNNAPNNFLRGSKV